MPRKSKSVVGPPWAALLGVIPAIIQISKPGSTYKGICNCDTFGPDAPEHVIKNNKERERHQRYIDGMALTGQYDSTPNSPLDAVVVGPNAEVNTEVKDDEEVGRGDKHNGGLASPLFYPDHASDSLDSDTPEGVLSEKDDDYESDNSSNIKISFPAHPQANTRNRSGPESSDKELDAEEDLESDVLDQLEGETEPTVMSIPCLSGREDHPWIPPKSSHKVTNFDNLLSKAVMETFQPISGLMHEHGFPSLDDIEEEESEEEEGDNAPFMGAAEKYSIFGQSRNGFLKGGDDYEIGSDGEDDIDWDDFVEKIMATSKKVEANPLYMPLEDSLDKSYGYQEIQNTPISLRDALSYAILDIKSSHSVVREAHDQYTQVIKATSSVKPYIVRTTANHLTARTGIRFVEYDCCPNSCMCYAAFSSYTQCTHCGEDCYDGNGKARAKFLHIPIIHRLCLQFANPKRARKLTAYRASVEARSQESNDGLSEDFWTGELCRDQKKQGLYDQDTDQAFFFSTDGVRLFKTRSNFQIYPLLFVNLCLPPIERVKKRNMMMSGIIPGPKAPKDLDSFLWPIIKEFKRLESGVLAWNGCNDCEFLLKAYMPLIGADMVARQKLMHMQGPGSYRYCFYCTASGIYNRYVYCPFHPPNDPPNAAEKLKPEWKTYDPLDLARQSDALFRSQASHIMFELENEEYVSMTGITGISILSCLKCIDFPRSFPIDFMHLFYENVVGHLFNHWRGRFYTIRSAHISPANASDVIPQGVGDLESGNENQGSDTDEEHIETTERRRGRKRKQSQPETARKRKKLGESREARPEKSKAERVGRAHRGRKSEGRRLQNFEKTADEYCIDLNDWATIGLDMEKSRGLFPSSFGENIRSIFHHYHEWKAAEWSNWTKYFAPVYLKGYLPDEDYKEFMSLTSAINTCCDYTNTASEREDVRKRMASFLHYYERRYYRFEWERLSAMRPVFHHLAHAADCLDEAGPGCVYWQFPMERQCGMMVSKVKSRCFANKNLANINLLNEQKNHLLFTIGSNLVDDLEEQTDANEDRDGSANIYKIFCNMMKGYIIQEEGDEEDEEEGKEGKDDKRHINGVPYFQGRAARHQLTKAETGLIISFLDTQLETPTPIPAEAIPVSVSKRYSMIYPKSVESEALVVRSFTMRKENETRTASWVRYEQVLSNEDLADLNSVDEEDEGDNTRSAVGKVLFFFRLKLNTEQIDPTWNLPLEYDLAFIESVNLYGDDLLLYRIPTEKPKEELVPARDIRELVGLLTKGERQYLITKGGPMLSGREE